MRTIPLTLAAGIVTEFAVSGRYFRLFTTTAPVNVSLVKKAREVYEAIGVEAGLWEVPENGFDGVRITSATPQTIAIAVSNGHGGYDRLTGTMNIDPEDFRYFLGDDEIRDGEGFFFRLGSGPIAAQFPMAQLWNPAASGVVAYVDTVYVSPRTATDAFELSLHNASVLVNNGAAGNKNGGGAASATEMHSGTSAAPFGTSRAYVSALLNQTEAFRNKTPFRVPPGWGLVATGSTVNTLAVFSFDFREKLT